MIFKRYLLQLRCCSQLFVTAATHAMTIETRGNTVYATGELGDDYVKFKEVFAQPASSALYSSIRRAGFVEQHAYWPLDPGARTGHRCSQLLRSPVARSCSWAGKNALSDAFRPEATLLGLHGPHNRDTKVVSSSQAVQIYHFLKESMGDRFNSKVMEMALYEMDDADSLLRVFDATRPPKRLTFHCRSALVSHAIARFSATRML